MIYDFDDSIHYLKSTLETRAKTNPSYSLRAFAKKLGLSPAGLSQILNKKKKLSADRAFELSVALGLVAQEREYFIALVQLEGAKSEALRLQCLERVKSLNPNLKETKNIKQSLLTLEHFKLISEWYGLALFELLGTSGEWTVKAISKKLGLNKVEVEVMLERLLKLEMIEEAAPGVFTKCSDSAMVSAKIPNEALRNYYENLHSKSRESIRTQSPQEKVIASQVFAFDPSQITEVEKLTDEFLNNLEALAKKGKNKTEIYQAITNVFRLSQKEMV